MEFSRQENWSVLPCPSLGDLPDLGIEPGSPAWQADSLLSELLGKSTYMEFNSVQLLSYVRLIVTSWTAACQASLSINNSWSLLKLMSIKLVMASNHVILCHPFLLLPSIFHSIRVLSSESALCIGWPKYWSSSFSISPSNEYSELIFFRIDWLDLLAVDRKSHV